MAIQFLAPVRLVGWLQRFLLATKVLGLRAATTIFFLGRRNNARRQITLPDGRRFTFRGKLDQGVVSHFYKDGYRIIVHDKSDSLRIIDAGANIGDETVRFLYHCPNATIVAIEAEERNFELLRENVADAPNVRCIHGGLWPVDCRLELVGSHNSANPEAFRVWQAEDPDGLEAWSVPRIMDEMDWDAVDILKLDIEGSEYEIFTKNADNWIRKVNGIIIEVADHEREGTIQAMFAALGEAPFNAHICGENLILIRAGMPWSVERVVGFANRSSTGKDFGTLEKSAK